MVASQEEVVSQVGKEKMEVVLLWPDPELKAIYDATTNNENCCLNEGKLARKKKSKTSKLILLLNMKPSPILKTKMKQVNY